MDQSGILYYVGPFPKLSESFILNEINELSKRGHNVAVFAQYDPGENIAHDEHEALDIPVYYADSSYAELPKLLSKDVARMVMSNANDLFQHLSPKEAVHNLLLGKECAEFIDSLDFEIDIVHAHFAWPSRVGSMLGARYHGIPCTVTAHAIEIFRSPNVPQIKYICDSTDHVIVPSEYNRDYLREDIEIENDITVVPATTQLEKFEPTNPTVENRLLTVARLVEKKGHPFGIEAVNQLIRQGYDIEYHIVGTGAEKERLKDQVEKYGVESHVEFLGHISDERLKKELTEAAVFVLPCIIADDGDRDAMPVVLKEAMASETACVSTTVSAIPELITDGHDGLLVPEKDSEELATAIKELLDTPEKREKIAKNGRETVHNKFDIVESVDTLTKVFGSLRSS